MKQSDKALRNKKYSQYLVMALVIIAVLAAGLIILGKSRASSNYAVATASSGTLAGNATTQTSSSVSSGKYVSFNAPVSSGNSLCGFKTTAPTVNKVMVIWEENHDYSSIIGSSTFPYINTIATDCANATSYYALGHPSLPNYMTLTSSTNNGSSYYTTGSWGGDGDPSSSLSTTTNSIFQQLGSNWMSFAEDMGSNCQHGSSGLYGTKHNPAAYYTNIASTCSTNDVGFSSSTKSSGAFYNAIQSGLPALSTVTPNLCNDMHNSGCDSTADNWLKGWIPVITAGKDYQAGNLAVLLVMDEGSGSSSTSSSHTLALGLSAYTKPATVTSTSFDNNSVLKTMEDITGQSYIGGAAGANSMVTAFGFK